MKKNGEMAAKTANIYLLCVTGDGLASTIELHADRSCSVGVTTGAGMCEPL